MKNQKKTIWHHYPLPYFACNDRKQSDRTFFWLNALMMLGLFALGVSVGYYLGALEGLSIISGQ